MIQEIMGTQQQGKANRQQELVLLLLGHIIRCISKYTTTHKRGHEEVYEY